MTSSLTTRRTFLGASVGALALAGLAACADPVISPQPSGRILPTDPLVAEYEKRRAASGTTVTHRLSAAPLETSLQGRGLTTWGYNDGLNGPLLRAQTGDLLKVSVANDLPEDTSVHWHGLALRNDADGVQGVTQDPIAAGGRYTYGFRLSHPGTYWYHSHFDTQRERALYGALIVEDPNEPLSYDQEWVVILDDWLDGITGTPQDVVEELSAGMDMSGDMEGMAGMAGTRSSSVRSQWLASSNGGRAFSAAFTGAEAQRRSLAGASSCRGVSPPRSSSGICTAIPAWACGSSGRVPSSNASIATHASRLASAGRWPRMAVPILRWMSGRGRSGRSKRGFPVAAGSGRHQRGVIVMRAVSCCK